MPNLKKQEAVKGLKDKLDKTKSLVFVDYQGLTHKQLEELRKSLKPSGGELEINKNTLIKIALGKSDLDLSGPTGVLFSYNDEVSALSELAKFIKKAQLPKIKFGIIDDEIYQESEVIRLASLPGKEVLLSQVVGGLKAPLAGIVYALNGNLQKLVLVLNEIKNNKKN